jgi:hypothetical protein
MILSFKTIFKNRTSAEESFLLQGGQQTADFQPSLF